MKHLDEDAVGDGRDLGRCGHGRDAGRSPPKPSTQVSGRVVSANPAHPVAGATVHLVPVAAIDTTTRMTASAIYAAPYPAEAYDEPLEDAIRSKGAAFPQATTDARGNFAIATLPTGKFFVHVTPSARGHRAPARWGPQPAELMLPTSCVASR